MDEEIYFCQHCNGLIESLNEACNHKCFLGKEHIYQSETDSSVLFVNRNENQESDEKEPLSDDDFGFHTSSSPVDTGNFGSDEDLNDSEDFKSAKNVKKNAVWTKKATMAMLSLYEAKIHMLKDVGKRSQVWKKISEGLKDLCIQVTADQVKWKFNRLHSKYKECVDNNSKSGRAPMTFDFYEQFEHIFHKEKNVSIPHTLSSSIFKTNNKKRKNEENELNNRNEDKKCKLDATPNGKSLPSTSGSQKQKTSPVACDKRKKNQQRLQSLEILQNIQENQKSRDDKMTKYLKIKEKEVELKKKTIDVREMETQVKKDVASEKLKFNEKKHKDWLNIEKVKCELLTKLLRNRNDSED